MTEENTPFPVSSFEKLANLESNNWWFRSRNRIILWALKKYVGNFKNYLEIGCGTGYVLEGIHNAFPQAEVHGSEFFAEGMAHAQKRVPSANFRQLDATRMDDQEQFDVVGAFDVIEHIDEDCKAIKNIHSALKSGGSLVVTVPQHQWLWSHVDEFACHKRRYSRAELIGKLENAGFQIIHTTSFVSFLVPLMWASRLKATPASDYDPTTEFLIPGWLNSLLGAVMSMELAFIRLGVSLPAGGSLLVIAKKT